MAAADGNILGGEIPQEQTIPELMQQVKGNIWDMLGARMAKQHNLDAVRGKVEEPSICCDSEMDELIEGIVGILEGFGLLDHKVEGNGLPLEVESYVISVIQAETGDMAQPLIGQQFTNRLARMHAAEPDMALPEEAKAQIKELVSEYLRSLENTNHGANNEAMSPNGEPSQGLTDTDKMMVMLKTAIHQAMAPGRPAAKAAPHTIQEAPVEGDLTEQPAEPVPVQHLMMDGPQTAERAQQTMEAPEEVPVTPQDTAENVTRIVDRMTARLEDGKQEFDVQLKPEFLGKLSIKVVMEDGGIKAQIKAADLTARAMITEQLPSLTEMLKDKGVNMTQIEVVYDQMSFDSAQQQFQNHQSNSQRPNVRRARMGRIGIDGVGYDLPAAVSGEQADLAIRHSSVEFSA